MKKKREECNGCPFWDETKEFCFFFQGGCLWEDNDVWKKGEKKDEV